MNLILFEPAELSAPLPRTDARAAHVLTVLRRAVGDTFDCGLINGPRGKATLAAVSATALTLTFTWDATPPPAPAPITLLLGLPRPQTARDLLRDTTTLGVAALHFVLTDRSDRNYASSSLWSSGEWRRHLLIGAEQAFDTHLPTVTHSRALADVLATLAPPTAPSSTGASTRLVLDNYESPTALSACSLVSAQPIILALGPERGWSAGERDLFRAHAFTFAHLGSRVLRAETAALAAVTLIRARLGLM